MYCHDARSQPYASSSSDNFYNHYLEILNQNCGIRTFYSTYIISEQHIPFLGECTSFLHFFSHTIQPSLLILSSIMLYYTHMAMQKLNISVAMEGFFKNRHCTIESFIIYSANINYLPCARQCARLLRYVIKQKVKRIQAAVELSSWTQLRQRQIIKRTVSYVVYYKVGFALKIAEEGDWEC